jgi:hypothetical protein
MTEYFVVFHDHPALAVDAPVFAIKTFHVVASGQQALSRG